MMREIHCYTKKTDIQKQRKKENKMKQTQIKIELQ